MSSYSWALNVLSPLFLTSDPSNVLIDTADPLDVGDHIVQINILPQPAAYLYTNAAELQTSFLLHVFD
jgi:hypothetical protein